jgi:hypothetical protein
MKSTNTIASLNISLNDLYEGKKQIIINLADKPHQYHVVLCDRSGKADCKISSWSANLWARTKKGIIFERYNSLSSLQSALLRLVGSKVETVGDVTFTLSDDVMTT